MFRSLRKKSPYSELFWPAFFPQFPAFPRMRTEYREIFINFILIWRKF